MHPIPPLWLLLRAHFDAWGLTSLISLSCLILHHALSPHSLSLVIGLAAAYAFAFALNDLYDAPFDRHDPLKARLNPFVHSPHLVRPFTLGSIVLLIALALLFASFGSHGVPWFALSLFVAWSYSAPPLRLKHRPGWDLLTHALFVETYPYWLCLVLLQLPLQSFDLALLGLMVIASLSAQLEQQLRDFELDQLSAPTFAIRIGAPATHFILKMVSLLLILFTCLGFLGGILPLTLLPLALIGAPIVLHRFVRPPHAPRPRWLSALCLIGSASYLAIAWLLSVIMSA